VAVERAAGVCYVDTSALVKRYLAEPGSDAFDAFCALPDIDRVICPLVATEFTGVSQRRVRNREITARQAGQMRSRFHADLSSGAWALIEFGADVFSRASDLMTTLTVPLATLDALHLACALQHGADQLATGDLQLATAARKTGLRVHTF